MPEGKRPDLEVHWEASAELDTQAKRIRDWLEDIAKSLASTDSGRPDELRDLVERKHVLLAAERLITSNPTGLVLSDFGHGIFLSYSTKDEDFARELEVDLRAEGVKTFLAPLSIKPGASWPDEIWQAIRNCRALVLLVTADALKSKWCLLEIGAAFGLRSARVSRPRRRTRLLARRPAPTARARRPRPEFPGETSARATASPCGQAKPPNRGP